ncbi:MAG: hypothetical protein KGJ78_12690 [Alphaproteobacteria bacterium]|nr:hypothetical protein [Alphaproteobacteria bacterium]
MPEQITKFLAAVQASFKTHQWYWVGGGGGAVVVAILAVLVFGGVFGPSGRAICEATLSQAKDFGVIPPDATLSSTRAKSTDVDGRRQCTASSAGTTYNLLVDVKKADGDNKKCKDFKKQAGCLGLYSVATADGMSTYQVKQVPDDDQDAALPPDQAAGGGQGATADPNALDTTTATDNSGVMPSAPANNTAPQPPADNGAQPQ